MPLSHDGWGRLQPLASYDLQPLAWHRGRDADAPGTPLVLPGVAWSLEIVGYLVPPWAWVGSICTGSICTCRAVLGLLYRHVYCHKLSKMFARHRGRSWAGITYIGRIFGASVGIGSGVAI